MQSVILASSILMAHGVWDALLPVNVGPLSNRWSSAASAGSCMYISGGTGISGNASFQYDTNDMEWTQLPDLPDSYLAPATLAYGGLLVMIGGQGSFGRSDDVIFVSTTNSSGGWQTAPIAGSSFGVRNGHRALALGGLVYVFGGWDGATYFNDLWGLDLASLLLGTLQSNGAPPAWVQLLPNASPGMMQPRSSFSWDAVGGSAYVFGGTFFSHPSGQPSTRLVFGDVWVFAPVAVSQLAPYPAGNPPQGWSLVPPPSSATAPSPSCRYGHTTGVLGSTLFVFGGMTFDACGATGTTTPVALADLWSYDTSANAWSLLDQGAIAPGPLGVPAGLVVGQALYVYGGSAADDGFPELWRWTLQPAIAPPPAAPCSTQPTNAAYPAAIASLAVTNACTVVALAVLIWWYRCRRGNNSRNGGLSDASMGSLYSKADF